VYHFWIPARAGAGNETSDSIVGSFMRHCTSSSKGTVPQACQWESAVKQLEGGRLWNICGE
jgi:hypothetical protein